ncbi:oligosaccharide flippase family protein [Clostridium saccharobutylicum]|uniref:Membrane protein involved in the export of O-antigen and teichoic acid n=1 Tax=Clostridium saccharobutylicum DSM 13864 TaxID=1345695 RepID=U5MWD3_CLOSA|nr:oligosaccharide flippase family protein [Clostridium saccharobutylicum]AGX45104.1 membrane protein involved in the export of O-antigen and teichoic acid [Clostridium saccharobutylicum DSM 13864]AQR92386.1 putative O-antigen transporter [Clostridium saccharobutylicum]AQS02289.1 putative O-antigen transporter [Clostridium saccharobutylicum]AQS16272.1 putative O-antigen transporter [Clostridium saccharobutylicum]MBA2904947.1 O-antigen/teichoic acid export membrane protein [Clostridium saccharo
MSKSISRNAIFNSILNLFNILLPILVIPSVSRAIGNELYGYMGYGDSLNNYFSIFASFGIYTYGLREISRVRDDKIKLRQTFTSLFVLTTITNILATLAYMAFVLFSYKGQPYLYTCIILGLNLAFNLFYVEWVNQALENYDFITIKTMIIRIVSCIIIIFLVRSKENYLFYLYVIVITNFLNNIVSFIYIKKRIKFDFSNLCFKKHLKPMIYAVILSNVGVLYTQLDKFMIKASNGTTDVGYYYMAQRIINMINTLLLTLVTVTMPRLSNYLGNDSQDKYLVLLKRVAKIYFIILFPASIGLMCLSNEVIGIFGGGEYLSVIPAMEVFSIYMLSLGIQNIISNQIIYLYQREKDDSILIFIGGIINLILKFILIFIGHFTIVTAIGTTLIANIIVIGLQYRLVKRVIKLNINLFNFNNMKYLVYSLIFIPITILIKSLTHNIIYICIIDVTFCSLFYIGALIITKDDVFFEMIGKVKAKLIRS